MAAPKFVPVSPVGAFRSGETLPAALEWRADRPGDLVGAQPKGTKLGNPGPDQGYAIKLANSTVQPWRSSGDAATPVP